MDRYSEWLDSILGQDVSQTEHLRFDGLITGQLSRRSTADLLFEVLASKALQAEFSQYWSEVVDSGYLPKQLEVIDAITYLNGLKETSRHRDSGPMALAELAESASTSQWVSSRAKAYREAMLTGFDDFDISPGNWLQDELILASKGHPVRLRSWGQLGLAYDLSKDDLPPGLDEMANGFCGRISKYIAKTVTTKRGIPGAGLAVDVSRPLFDLRAGVVDQEFKWIRPKVKTHNRLGLNVEWRTKDIYDEVLLAIESPDAQPEGNEGLEASRIFVGTWLVKGLQGWHGWIPLDAKATVLNMEIQSAFVLAKSPKSLQPESALDGVDVYVVEKEEDRTVSEGSESPFESGM